MSTLVNVQERLEKRKPVKLKADLSRLNEGERRMLPLFLEAAEAMEIPFWVQNYGDPEPLLASISAPSVRRYVRLNYGPWDRDHQHEPILPGVGSKPPGANFYPVDLTKGEFESAARHAPELKSPFTMVRRDSRGRLAAIPYHVFFQVHVAEAAEKLRQAAGVADLKDMQRFLSLRAEALLTDDYRASDSAWVGLRDSTLDLLIGPMEIEDRLFGIKAAYAASLLVKDWKSSAKLRQYTAMLPHFQQSLPVPAPYKQEQPGSESDLSVYDAVRFTGLDGLVSPAGVAWPNDEHIQLQKGMRFLLLGNVLRAKYEALLAPLAVLLIDEEQRRYASYHGNFNFVMFHELAHGLGVKNTLNGKRSAREALGDLHHPIEEAKADLVGLQIAVQLYDSGQLQKSDLWGVFVTSLVRLLYNYDGVQSVMRLNYFKKAGAYSRDARAGTYRVHPELMPAAIETLTRQLIRFQGDGDYQGAAAFIERFGRANADLELDIQRMEAANIPDGIELID